MDNIKRYTLRMDSDLLEKVSYVAKYEGRSTNKQIEVLLRKHVEEFEDLHGEIQINETD